MLRSDLCSWPWLAWSQTWASSGSSCKHPSTSFSRCALWQTDRQRSGQFKWCQCTVCQMSAQCQGRLWFGGCSNHSAARLELIFSALSAHVSAADRLSLKTRPGGHAARCTCAQRSLGVECKTTLQLSQHGTSHTSHMCDVLCGGCRSCSPVSSSSSHSW